MFDKKEYQKNYYKKNKESISKRKKEWYRKKNPDVRIYSGVCSDMVSYKKNYREVNKEHIKNQKKEYYKENREHLLSKAKEYRSVVKDITVEELEEKKQYHREYRKNNSDYLKKYIKDYYIKNREKILQKQKEYREARRLADISYVIEKEVKVLSEGKETSSGTKWRKELNLVSWNGGKAKYDIRDWEVDSEGNHVKCGKGITLTEDEYKLLIQNE